MKSPSKQLFLLICLGIIAGSGLSVLSASVPKSPQSAPTDADIFDYHVFQEPLVPIGSKTTPAENTALNDAINSYAKRVDRDDDSGITSFLKQYPKSPWRSALLLDLGLEYRQTGWFLKALAAWERAWEISKDATEPKAKALADRTIAELAELNARLGYRTRVAALLKQIRHRPLVGSATEKITNVREGNWMMLKEPEKVFNCGAAALNRIHAVENPDETSAGKIFDARSTRHGISLLQLKQLARELQMDYIAAKRQPGAKVIVPSVVKWRAEHFAALVKEENGRFLMQDTGSNGDIWVSQAALDAESSGYFLVRRSKLPDGWQFVGAKEASLVWGSGATQMHDDRGTSTKDDKAKKDCLGSGMAVYNFHMQTVSLNITDTPIGWDPPRGPAIRFTATYNQREADQLAFNYSNLGPKWTFNWLSYIEDDSEHLSARVKLHPAGGGTELYINPNLDTGRFDPEFQSGAILWRRSVSPNIIYERTLSDGSREIFAQSNDATGTARKVFLTERKDAAGNSAHLTYDANLRLMTITDALGKSMTLSYDGDDYRIRRVTINDPLNRFAQFDYTNGQLIMITDPVGIMSQFGYSPTNPDFIRTLTTPYRTTIFTKNDDDPDDPTRFLESLDSVTGERERVEFKHDALGIPPPCPNPTPTPACNGRDPDFPSDLINDYLNKFHNFRNSFYWDKKAMALYPPVNGVPDYTKAKLIQWLHGSSLIGTNSDTTSNIKEREKEPLENPVYYFYPGQGITYPDVPAWVIGTSGLPKIIAQKLQISPNRIVRMERNALGNVTQQTDPVGRTFSYSYWIHNPSDPNDPVNMVDVKEVRQIRSGNELVFQATYNLQHRPMTETDAAGQPTTYGYNSFGQIETVENAKHETTTYSYGDGGSPAKPMGYLVNITGPVINNLSAGTNFTYDSGRRVQTVRRNPDLYVVTIDYDDLDRPTQITYPDATTEQFAYTDNVRGMTLDLTASKDRLNRWTYRHYNSNRQMDVITEPGDSPRTTHYDWCTCGSLDKITDPNSHETRFNRDLQGRVYQKVFHDGTTIDYLYEGQGSVPQSEGTTSRLASSIDALGRWTRYSYYNDDNVSEVRYTDAGGNQLVPATPTVHYSYDPNYNRIEGIANGVASIDHEYYQINSASGLNAGRLHTVHESVANETISFTYDELGRVASQSINGGANTEIVDYDSLGRLWHTQNALGVFRHQYDGVTARLQSLSSSETQQTTTYSYYLDNEHDRRLQTIQNSIGAGQANASRFDYTYDAEGQIMSWIKLLDTTESGLWFDYDNAKQLRGARNAENISNARKKLEYVYDPAGNRTFDRDYNPNPPPSLDVSNTYGINAVNQVETRTLGGIVEPEGPQVFVYDAVGNLTDDGAGKTFEWDAANRLIAINYIASGNRTEFAYDGLGRRVKITEYGSGMAAEIEPHKATYTTFNVWNFTLHPGNYTLTLQGLNPSGGDNAMLIDSVRVNTGPLSNGSFEDPTVNGYQINPSGASWSFSGPAGIGENGGVYGDPSTAAGDQAAFVSNHGSLSQTFNFPLTGTCKLSFEAAQRSGNESSQQLRVTLRSSLAIISRKTFVWCGNTICEERDGENTVMKRFFTEGEQQTDGISTTNYYYTRDHLGSIREVTDSGGAVVAQYDYDPYGKQVVLSGQMVFDFGYTGHYYHASSGLNLTLYRAYDPKLGRWLSRDPIGEQGGINLYAYVGNDPDGRVDPFGLDWLEFHPTGFRSTPGGGRVTGNLQWHDNNGGVITYPAVSGGHRGQGTLVPQGDTTALPNGNYSIYPAGYVPDRTDGYERDGVGFSFRLTPNFVPDPMRTDLLIHPDGPPPGTAGCIGLRDGADRLRDFRTRLLDYLRANGSMSLNVYKSNYP